MQWTGEIGWVSHCKSSGSARHSFHAPGKRVLHRLVGRFVCYSFSLNPVCSCSRGVPVFSKSAGMGLASINPHFVYRRESAKEVMMQVKF